MARIPARSRKSVPVADRCSLCTPNVSFGTFGRVNDTVPGVNTKELFSAASPGPIVESQRLFDIGM
ncbi:MAG: hypothetical protein KDC00_09070 [Flavobacteriales bacterium]|nr:hypothetical protein [Flavobacteriales bacterium]